MNTVLNHAQNEEKVYEDALTEYTIEKDKEIDLDYFLQELNNLINKFEKRYTPDDVRLYFNGRKILIKYNYKNKQYEVV